MGTRKIQLLDYCNGTDRIRIFRPESGKDRMLEFAMAPADGQGNPIGPFEWIYPEPEMLEEALEYALALLNPPEELEDIDY